jgi:D-hexose-6-phosphate mutarotase
MADVDTLNGRFKIPGVAEVISGEGRLPAVRVNTKAGVTGLVYLHGGHVAAWKPPGFEEVLWVSSKSSFENLKPIRGGVPICFPWFGPNKDHPNSAIHPMHGFARLRQWTLETIEESRAGVTVFLSLKGDMSTRPAWPHDFTLRHRVTFGSELKMALELTNTGSTPLTAEEAQHTYFSLADVRQVRVTGLEGKNYIDKSDGFKVKAQDGAITITGETDRVYLQTTDAVTIEDPGKGRRIRVSKDNSGATVVWNPWIARARAMTDFGDEEWPGMMCVETCNVGEAAVTVSPGKTHVMTTVISVEKI